MHQHLWRLGLLGSLQRSPRPPSCYGLRWRFGDNSCKGQLCSSLTPHLRIQEKLFLYHLMLPDPPRRHHFIFQKSQPFPKPHPFGVGLQTYFRLCLGVFKILAMALPLEQFFNFQFYHIYWLFVFSIV